MPYVPNGLSKIVLDFTFAIGPHALYFCSPLLCFRRYGLMRAHWHARKPAVPDAIPQNGHALLSESSSFRENGLMFKNNRAFFLTFTVNHV